MTRHCLDSTRPEVEVDRHLEEARLDQEADRHRRQAALVPLTPPRIPAGYGIRG